MTGSNASFFSKNSARSKKACRGRSCRNPPVKGNPCTQPSSLTVAADGKVLPCYFSKSPSVTLKILQGDDLKLSYYLDYSKKLGRGQMMIST